MTFIETGGMAIDFPAAEKGNNYFCATEDCSVHKCSISYPDQYMNSYYGHQGPVYRVRCNPYWDPNDNAIFLTCSYDWTVKVWNANAQPPKELLTCHVITKDVPGTPNAKLKAQVNDIMWSPITSSCFASVADDGRIEIWDLKLDPINPRKILFDDDDRSKCVAKTVVRFLVQGSKAPIILTGNSNGHVDVYRSYGLKHGPVSFEDQKDRLQSALKKNDFADSGEQE